MGQIEDLYVSGIASAKAGNHRLAQAFFKKVVQTNPRHEGAWMWLSEVLEDPEDIAYCLEAALAINPHNEKARVALEVVRQRSAASGRPPRPKEWSPLAELRDMELPKILAATPATVPPPPRVPLHVPVREPGAGLRRAALFALAVLAVLVLAVYMGIQTDGHRPEPATPAPATVDPGKSRPQEREAVQVYLRDFDLLLGPLRLAHDVFHRESNERVSLAEQVQHVGRLRVQVRAARVQMQKLLPPALLNEAHQEYVQGLVLEEEALDSLLRYFETSQVGFSNQAAVKFQESKAHIDRAKATLAAYRQWAGMPEPTRLPTPTSARTPTYGPSPTVTPTYRPYPTFTPTPPPTQPIG